MDPRQIKALIDAMASSDLSEMEFSQDGWTLRLLRRPGAAAPEALLRTPLAVPVPATTLVANEFRSPLYGVVHLQATPGGPPFVVAGVAVKAGQTLCVIEAMKVFNEVRAEHDATVESVLVSSGQEVEAGQPLLRFASKASDV